MEASGWFLVSLLALICCASKVAAAPESCVVLDVEKVPCGEPNVSTSRCDALNCCFDGLQCYYGKAGKILPDWFWFGFLVFCSWSLLYFFLSVTVQCTRDGQFIIVVARDATLPGLNLASISLLGGSSGPCGPVDFSEAFAIYQFPVTACGTTMTVGL